MTSYTVINTEYVHPFNVVFSVCPEDMRPDWDFESMEDEKEVLRKIDAGLLEWFVARVSVEFDGVELGCDYLGGCCYESFEDFYLDGGEGYYSDMKNNALCEARTMIDRIVKLSV